MKLFRSAPTIAFLLAMSVPPSAFAQFTVANGSTVGAQTLAGTTGTVNAGGIVSTGGNTVAVTINGTATLNNNGTIRQTGTGRAIDSNSGTSNLTVSNSGLIAAVSTDAFRVNTAGSSVSLTNAGTIQVTAGGQAIDWAAIATGSNILTNLSTGVITAMGEDAVRPGVNGVVINAGVIAAAPTGTSSPSGSDGIDLRTLSGISVTNSGTISGRHGIATDGANVGPSALSVTNNAGGMIVAVNGSGINVDGVNASVTANVTNAFGAVIKGGVHMTALDGDGDGIDVDGVLTLHNSGDILGLGAKGGTGPGNNSEGVAAGGGSITNTATGRIVGSSLLADAPNGNAARAGNGILIDDSNGGNAVAATTVINSGLIQGKSGFGIKTIGTFGDTITNNVGGTIRGTAAAGTLQTGDGADTVTNGGTIQNDAGSLAIALEGGNDLLNVTGGSAAINGHIDGGTGTNTMNVTPGVGGTFSYAGQITNFNSVNVGVGRFNLGASGSVDADVVVASGGILAGTGSLLRSVSLQNGGQIAAGNSPGTLSISGNLNLAEGAAFTFELGADQAGSDLVVVGGALNFAGSGKVLFNLVNLGLLPGSYDLIRFNSLSGLSAGNLALGSVPLGLAGDFVIDGDSVSFVVTAIPEPSAYAVLIGAGVLGVVAVRRRRAGVGGSSGSSGRGDR